MQDIIVEKPYRFIPPHRGTWMPRFIRRFDLQGRWLRTQEGIVDHECRGTEHLRRSIDHGHGIMLTPNHCRTGDPLVIGWLSRQVDRLVYAMASWHLFNEGRFTAWAIRQMGGFSVNREGVDRKAIDTAIQILETAERPLVIFPEGSVTRTNDRLHSLLDGVAFIAKTAAKRRLKRTEHGKVVVHPVALKYLFGSDIDQAADDVLTGIEERLSWQPQRHLSHLDRVAKVGTALLCMKEIEYLGTTQSGTLKARLGALTHALLQPLEEEWNGKTSEGDVVPRVKALRMKLLPDMIHGSITDSERARRREQLTKLQLAQQLSYYIPSYLMGRRSVDRLWETLERFEEDLNGQVRVHGSLKVIIEVGEAIEVNPQRDRLAPVDPLMQQIESRLQAMLDRLALESRPLDEST